MYRALYKYSDQEGNGRTLSFKTGDEFNLIEQVNEHWWKMQSLNGDIGLVPATYLAINKVSKISICLQGFKKAAGKTLAMTQVTLGIHLSLAC